jgi:drug/metabolite transporter (DMT)-like permease
MERQFAPEPEPSDAAAPEEARRAPTPAPRPHGRAESRSARPVVGIAFKVASAFVFTIMVALIKIVAERVPTGEIAFARNFFALLPVVVMIVARGELTTAFRTSRPLGHLGRATVGVLAMLLWFESVGRLPLADATAISYAAPLITVALAVVLLHEKVRRTRWAAVSVGLLGVLIVLSPHLSGAAGGERELVGALSASLAAVFMAFAMIFIRTLTGTEGTSTIVVYFSLASSVLALLTIPFGWVVPSPTDAALLVAIGIIGGIGQLLLTQSYRYADASVIAPFEYTTMIWTLIAGFAVFGEVPSLVVLVGAAIIIASGVAVILRESRLGLHRPERSEAAPPKA